jgi:Rieske Fe-S protein
LLHALQASMAATLAAIFYPVARFLRPREAATSGALEVVAPFKANQVPDAQGHWPPPFNFGGKPCLVVRTPDGQLRAFNAECTHADCTVEFRPEKEDIFCNCHNGVYDLNGRNISGPPPKPLKAYEVTLRGAPGGKPGEEEIVVSRTT